MPSPVLNKLRYALAAAVLVVVSSAPAFALHRSFPDVVRLSSGAEHQVPSGRSWGFQEVFSSDVDLLQTGTTGRQIFFFRMFDYACQRGIIRPDILVPGVPCPDPPQPFLVQVTSGPGDPDNPSVSDPSGNGTPNQRVAFDAGGIISASTGAAALHRQIYFIDLKTNVLTQLTHGIDGESVRPSLSAGGAAMAWESTASENRVDGGPAGVSQVYAWFTTKSNSLDELHTLQLTHGQGPSTNASFNKNGSMVVFESTADLLGDGHDTGVTQIFVAKIDRKLATSTLIQITGGNAPSRHPWLAEREAPGGFFQSGVWFDSTATNLPGTVGEPGSHIFQADVDKGSLPVVTQKTFTNPMGDCTFPSIDQFATTVAFICTGDPYQNGTTGNRVFAEQQNAAGVVTLFQLTGRGDIQGPISVSPGHNFVLVADNTDLTGVGSCSYQLELIDFFDDNLTDNIHQHWTSATSVGQVPQDLVAPTSVGPPPVTTNALGSHLFHLVPGTPTGGSQLTLTTSLGTFPLQPILGKGDVLLDFSPRDFKGESIVKAPGDQLLFPPLPVPGLGVVCVHGATDGNGILDCDGGRTGVDLTISRDHNTNDSCTNGCREDAPCHGPLPAPHPGVCNGPQTVGLSGQYGAGSMVLRLPLSVSLQATPGLDDYCGPGNDYVLKNVPVTLMLTTGSARGSLLDADDTMGATLTASATGAPLDCSKLVTGDFTGTHLVGQLPLLDLPTPFPPPFDHLDAIVTVRLVGGDVTCINCICIPTPCATDGECDNNNVCDGTDTCSNRTCIPGTYLDCDDNNPCTSDYCDGLLGCQHVAITGACDDGNACTSGDTCQAGVCTGIAVTCNDNNPCTLDTCDPTLGCNYPDRCSDNDVCNGIEACDIITNTCSQVVAALNCDDLNPCTDDSCDPLLGCVHTANTAPCDDLSLCTFNDTCSNGACLGVPVLCDDGDHCNGLETCDSATGACLPGGLPNCDDGNTCTADSCDPAVGCVHTNVSGTCDDNSVCTTGDTCVNGVCQGTLIIICDNGDPCDGVETCNPVSGACGPGPLPTCDDGDVCTDDSCTPFVGCLHTPNTAPCDDGKRCTFNDTCSGGTCGGTPVPCENGNVCDGVAVCDSASGACVAGPIPDCDDGNQCTDDTCDPLLGCQHQNNTSPCDDGDLCTLFEKCDGNGVCVGTPVSCTDNDRCNGEEICNPATGACMPGTPPDCNDGNVCTADSCDPVAGCLHNKVLNYNGCSLNQIDQIFLTLYQNVRGAPIGSFSSEKIRARMLSTVDTIRRKLEPAISGATQSKRPIRAALKKANTLANRILQLEAKGKIVPALADTLSPLVVQAINLLAALL